VHGANVDTFGVRSNAGALVSATVAAATTETGGITVKRVMRINHVLIVLFAVASGVFKLVPRNTDIEIFAHIGMGAAAVAVFGVVQACGGCALVFRRTTRVAALVVAGCNLLATVGLFVAGIQPFAAISLLFVGMALLELRRARTPHESASVLPAEA
jgi:hypothetical protein